MIFHTCDRVVSFSDAETLYGESVEDGRDVLSILGRIFCHKTSTYAVYDSCTAMVKTHFALPYRSHVDNLPKFNNSCIDDCNLGLVVECVE